MATRRERVVLELDDQFSGQLAKAAAAAEMFQRKLGKTRGETDRTSASMSKADRDTQKFSGTVTRSTRELDSFSGRMSILASAVGVLGPALVPIGAVGIPAVTGLAQSFGIAALAGGTAILAFQGVGDALKTMNEARLKPTQANLEKARAAMEELSPAARDLVTKLASMRGELSRLKDAAGSGILPGATAALADLETRLPIVEKILHQISVAAGSALQQGAESLAGPSWDRFFRFIANEARPELAKLAATVGNLAQGFANLWVAFGPLNNSFSSFLLKSARDFNQWATGLSATQGFQDFISYIRENGPKVGDALAAIGNALVQIVQAAAPVGGPLLESLTAVANVIATIADSPLGTPIFGAIAALSAFSLATKAWGGIAGSAVGKFIVGQREAGAAIMTNAAKMRVFGAVTQEQSAAASKGWRTIGKGALVLGGVAAASSGLTDKLHLTNTVLGASAGLVAGPWGAAIGAGIGLVADFASAHNDTSISVDEVTQTLNQQTGAITANTRVWAAKNLQDSGAADAAQALGLNLATVTSAALGNADAIAQVNAQLDALAPQALTGGGKQWEDADKTATAIANVRDAVGGSSSAVQQAIGKQRQFAGLMGTVAAASGTASRAVDRLATAITNLDGLLDKRGARNAFKQSVLDLRHAIKEEGADFRDSTLKGLHHRDMLDAIAKNAETVAEKVGPLERKRILREAVRDLEMFAGKSKSAKAYADPLIAALKVLEKQDPHIKIAVDAQQALAEIDRVRAYLDSLHGKSIAVNVTRRLVEQTGLPKVADGGYIAGPGGPRDDVIPAMLSNGEFVVNAAATARNRGLLEQINAQRFADGGYATRDHASRDADMQRYQSRQSHHSATNKMTISLGDVRVVGTLKTPWGPAQVEGIARAAAQDAVNDSAALDRTHAGMFRGGVRG